MTTDADSNESALPENIAAIKECGFVTWNPQNSPPGYAGRFDESRIPVKGVRHVRQWGIQVDDERAVLGRERTSVADQELWQVVLTAKDGSSFEVNSELVVPAE